ncbi:MAG: LysM peptidoglycan-binding domain-containing protein [Candidatus Onthomonas sp.]
MKLEFTRTEHSHFGLVQDTVCSREETLEMIVPDACPDIVQVTDTYGFCCLTRREMTDSGALLAGTVKVTILYLPEGGEGLRRLEAELPFQHLSECSQGDSNCRLMAKAAVVSAETRMMNPRKFLIRVDLRESVQIYRPEVLSVSSGLKEADSLGLQQRVEHYQTAFALEPGEKAFSLEETLTLPAGKSPVTELLRLQPNAYCNEARLIGSKLVFKGGVSLRLLCRNEEGELSSADFDLPLSQMMEAGGAGEGAIFQTLIQVLDWQLGPLSSDGRAVSVTVELAAQAIFYESVPVALITDAYSINYPVTLQNEPLHFQRLADCTVLRQPIRTFLEADGVRSVCGCHMELGILQFTREGEQATLTVPAEATVLYLNEQGGYRSQHIHFSVSVQRPLPSDGKLTCSYGITQLEALPAAAGIELRGMAEFQLRFRQIFEAVGLSEVDLDQEHPLDHTGQPSVVLRRPTNGEDLWSIAKRYATTSQEICGANGLNEDQPLGNQMLLIPRKR